MKATIDLPKELLRRLKLRAVQDGRKLKDVAAEFLRNGLANSSKPRQVSRLIVRKDKKTGLMVIQCPRAPDPDLVSPEKFDQLLLDQEIAWHRELG